MVTDGSDGTRAGGLPHRDSVAESPIQRSVRDGKRVVRSDSERFARAVRVDDSWHRRGEYGDCPQRFFSDVHEAVADSRWHDDGGIAIDAASFPLECEIGVSFDDEDHFFVFGVMMFRRARPRFGVLLEDAQRCCSETGRCLQLCFDTGTPVLVELVGPGYELHSYGAFVQLAPSS